MELTQTAVYSLSEIEALELETRALLEEVRGKKVNEKKQTQRGAASSSSAKESSTVKPQPAKKKTKKTVDQENNKTSTHTTTSGNNNNKASTLNLFPAARATIEILDDASPDVTPRTGGEDPLIAAERERQRQFHQLEKNFRSIDFSAEKTRISAQSDTFVPSGTLTVADVEKERQRLKKLQESAQTVRLRREEESKDRANYLKEDRAALSVQSLFRGHLGRRQAALARQLRALLDQREDKDDERGDSAKDWIEVTDKDTGDVWFYNQRTKQSQWERPVMSSSPEKKKNKSSGVDSLPKLPGKKKGKKSMSETDVDSGAARTLAVSMSMPSLEAMQMAKTAQLQQQEQLRSSPVKRVNSSRTLSTAAAAAAQQKKSIEEMRATQEVNAELGLQNLTQPQALLHPDGSFKPQLRTVVLDALLDTRFDNVSTVIADARWFEREDEPFPRVLHRGAASQQEEEQKLEKEKKEGVPFVPARVDPLRAPMVSVFNLHTAQKKKSKGSSAAPIQAVREEAKTKKDTLAVKDLTLNDIEHAGLDQSGLNSTAQQPEAMCFGCWSSGSNRRCSLHEGDDDQQRSKKLRPSQTMLLCRNWDLDVMRRRYRSEEIQELFMKKETSLRYDARRKKFHTVVEQRHPIYRMQRQVLERFNDNMVLFAKIKFWLNSMREVLRQGKLSSNSQEQARVRRLIRSMTSLAKVERFSRLHESFLPIAPITGYSWPERCGKEQYLFQHHDSTTGELIDFIRIEPIPEPKKLYLPREYHLPLPKTVPLPKGGFKEEFSADGRKILPGNKIIPDEHPAGWLERFSANFVRDSVDMALAQIHAITPDIPTDLLTRAKRGTPSTIKFATIGQKPTPGNLAIGGLPAEMLVYQIISTHFPPQYGNFMVMDKASVSPSVSPEISISFSTLAMPPTVEPYVERPLEHPLTYRRAPTITLNSFVTVDQKHVYGRNRPEQTGEQESHGFRTTTWAPQLTTFAEIDPQVFTPGQEVVSLNTPKANTSNTTQADHTYPFCEPSTRDNSTLDFYHLLLQGVVSTSKPQIFTALTVQEPGQFQKQYKLEAPMGHLVVSVYRSWAFTQQDTIQEFKTDDGISYWYHRKTGQTFWQRPLYEVEEVSPLQGGTMLDLLHDEEPSTVVKGAEGAQRRYTQGEFRKQMLMHLETKKDAINRRKAASVTLTFAKERGLIPDLTNAANMSMENNFASTTEMGAQVDWSRGQQTSSVLANMDSQFGNSAEVNPFGQTGGPDAGNVIKIQNAQGADQLMHMYGNANDINNFNNNDSNGGMTGSYQIINAQSSQGGGETAGRAGIVRGSRLDEGSAFADPSLTMTVSKPTHAGQATAGMNTMNNTSNMNMQIPGMDAAFLNQLSQTLGNMFATMMNVDRANPQDMIQLGLGMGMALMQTGAVNQMVQGQIDQELKSKSRVSGDEDDARSYPGMERVDSNMQNLASASQPLQMDGMNEGMMNSYSAMQWENGPSQTSNTMGSGAVMTSEPIGLPYPTNTYTADKALDHSEEQMQRVQAAQRAERPLNTMEMARNLKIEPVITDTPDVVPPKMLTDVRPLNYEDELRESNAMPLVAYPELSSQVPGGPPIAYQHKPPAGLGTSFVDPEQAESQLRVPGADHLRRTVMPLPVGFFDAIEAKHVAKQAVDYLPQVPNLPQARTIGRVKPRSAASDWLMISFDPWSAGRNPLGTEFVPSLAEKADRMLGAQAADIMDSMRNSALQGAYINIQDEEGLAQQRAEINKAQVLAQDFKKLCSLCRHSKFTDAEQLINQPDWSVPIDFQDDQGNTLLHVACQNGSKRLVKLCLRRGASLNIQNLNGQTPLHFAFGYGYTEVGEYLVSKGADDSVRNKDGLTCYEGLGARELSLL